MAEAAWRIPANRLAFELAVGNVESAIDENCEAQPRARAEFEHPHIAFDSVAERHQPHACKLGQGAAPLGDLSTRISV